MRAWVGLSKFRCEDGSSQYSREEDRLFLQWLSEEERQFLVASEGLGNSQKSRSGVAGKERLPIHWGGGRYLKMVASWCTSSGFSMVASIDKVTRSEPLLIRPSWKLDCNPTVLKVWMLVNCKLIIICQVWRKHTCKRRFTLHTSHTLWRPMFCQFVVHFA